MDGYHPHSSNVIKEETIQYESSSYVIQWHETNYHEVHEDRLLHAEFRKDDVMVQALRKTIEREKNAQQHFLTVSRNNGNAVVFEYPAMKEEGSKEKIQHAC